MKLYQIINCTECNKYNSEFFRCGATGHYVGHEHIKKNTFPKFCVLKDAKINLFPHQIEAMEKMKEMGGKVYFDISSKTFCSAGKTE